MARHRLVMSALAEELKGPIHALTLDVKTPDEMSAT
jgi:stress-induced morphogen